MKRNQNEKRLFPSRTFRTERQVDRQWQKSNCALARLLNCYHQELNAAIAMAAQISRGIDELAEQMALLCRRTCRYCPDPCCILNTVWFDFRDLLLFHLLELPIPVCQAVSDRKDACPFLGHRGCRLPARSRPWMCIQYLCPPQLAILTNQRISAAVTIWDKIERIEKQRMKMETEVVCRIKHRQEEPDK
jgi:hypothetical protein